jgi:hypothetical protein
MPHLWQFVEQPLLTIVAFPGIALNRRLHIFTSARQRNDGATTFETMR